MDIVDLFNQKMVEFADDITMVCNDFKELKPALRLAINLDKRTPLKAFGKYASKYETYIMEKNEAFFLEETYTDISHKVNFDMIKKLKEVWQTLSPENKDTVWKYFQVLVYLHNKAVR
jgi:hypothetical protein